MSEILITHDLMATLGQPVINEPLVTKWRLRCRVSSNEPWASPGANNPSGSEEVKAELQQCHSRTSPARSRGTTDFLLADLGRASARRWPSKPARTLGLLVGRCLATDVESGVPGDLSYFRDCGCRSFRGGVLPCRIGDDADILDVVAFEAGFHYVVHVSVEQPDFWGDLGDEYAGGVDADKEFSDTTIAIAPIEPEIDAAAMCRLPSPEGLLVLWGPGPAVPVPETHLHRRQRRGRQGGVRRARRQVGRTLPSGGALVGERLGGVHPVLGLPRRDPSSAVLYERHRESQRPLPAGRAGPGALPDRGRRPEMPVLVTRSLDPTGVNRTRWAIRWKPALNAFAITFADRFPAAETY
jgi:hypothetical protein